jgi:Na+-translocating ferredoxin:NAD+ oxidoreductase RnfD subunit
MRWLGQQRLGGLRRFAVAITVLNVLGHTVLGFEQAWAVPFVAVLTAYATELLLEMIDAAVHRRPLKFRGGVPQLIDFLLSAHISGLAVAMLLYTNARLAPVICAAVIAIASKSIIRVRVDGASRHLFNPSNLGITLTLLAFPWVGIAPPYQFTENLDGVGDWLLPAIIVISGTALNARYTGRLPLLSAWLAGFVAQAVVRVAVSGAPLSEALFPALVPMSGVAFVLYTFYMATDPATTPSSTRNQVAFGFGIAVAYGLLVALHIVFGLFFALTLVCCVRGTGLAFAALWRQAAPVREAPAGLFAFRN